MSEGFFNVVRERIARTGMVQTQVDGLNAIIAEAKRRRMAKEPVAYIMATAWHETGGVMQPIREKGGRAYLAKYDTGKLAAALGNTPEEDGDGQLYAGRGYVQLTGRTNYENMGELFGVDLIGNPDLALDPVLSVKIMFEGMIKGSFTGKALANYIRPAEGLVDFVNARRIVNGTDQARTIAGYAHNFLAALQHVDLLEESRTMEAAGKTEKGSIKGIVLSGVGAVIAAGNEILGEPSTAVEALTTGSVLAKYLPIAGGTIAVISLVLFVLQQRQARKIKAARVDDQEKAA